MGAISARTVFMTAAARRDKSRSDGSAVQPISAEQQ